MQANEAGAAPIQSGISDAVEAVGTQAKLAAELGVTQQAVSNWVTQGWVPKDRAVEIECLTGVPRARLVDPKILDLVDPGTGL